MKPGSRALSISISLALSLVGVLLVSGCGGSQAEAGAGTAPLDVLANESLTSEQAALLDFAFDCASALPTMPHAKTRARAQAEVVAACFELGQPRRALAFLGRIENWRRGAGHADYALACAQRGEERAARAHAELALATAADLARRLVSGEDDGDVGVEGPQDWQRDGILVKLAAVEALLGDAERAGQLAAGVVPSEAGKLEGALALRADEAELERQLAAIDGLVATGSFEHVRNALESCIQLFARFQSDGELRTRVEHKIKASWGAMPRQVQLELLMSLARMAAKGGDRGKALALVQEAQLMLDGERWTSEDRIGLGARLAALRFLAGDEAEARRAVEAERARFVAERAQIVDIYRAATLAPVAEALALMGDTSGARAVYRQALDECLVNPNSRPRADALALIARSMALHALAPDAGLWTRLREARANLGQPW